MQAINLKAVGKTSTFIQRQKKTRIWVVKHYAQSGMLQNFLSKNWQLHTFSLSFVSAIFCTHFYQGLNTHNEGSLSADHG